MSRKKTNRQSTRISRPAASNAVEALLASLKHRGKRREKGRYAARLLFQFEVLRDGKPVRRRRRLCEERIVLVKAKSARQAYLQAQRRGRSAEHAYTAEGARILFQFIGVLALADLFAADPDEVWWEFRERIAPMERRAGILLRMEDLGAIGGIPDRKPGRLTVP